MTTDYDYNYYHMSTLNIHKRVTSKTHKSHKATDDLYIFLVSLLLGSDSELLPSLSLSASVHPSGMHHQHQA